METIFSEITRKARKVHECTACLYLLYSGFSEAGLLPEELEVWEKAKACGYKIQQGETYLEIRGTQDRQPLTIRVKPEIDKICHKYDI